MYDTTYLSLSTNAGKVFNALLLLFPEQYRKQFGDEMRLVFHEMYQEEIAKNGKVGIGFWFSQVGDITKSVIEQHINDIGKKGMKKYLQQTLHINKFNVIGGVLLLPVLTMIGVEVVSRIVQGDLFHYNRPLYAFISHSPLYWFPVLVTWVFLFPILAVLINFVSLVKNMRKKPMAILSASYLKKNVISLAILAIGVLFLIAMLLHDFAPCFLVGLIKKGIGQIPYIISFCKGA